MRTFARLHRAVVAGIAAAAALLVAVAAHAADALDEGAPSSDGWVAEGGSPSRCATSLERPLDGPADVAWTQRLTGTVASEPVAFGSWLVVDADLKGQHTLSIHQISDGRAVASRTFRTSLPLLPCVAAGVLYVRSAPNTVTGLSWRAPAITDSFAADAGAPIESFVATGKEIYVRTADKVLRFDAGTRVPVWTFKGKVRGRLALRGAHLYFVEYDDDGTAILTAVYRANGVAAATVDLGHHNGAVPSRPDDDPRIAVHAQRVLVTHGLDVPMKDGRPARVCSVRRDLPANMVLRLTEPKIFSAVEEPLGLPDGWLLSIVDAEGPYLFRTGDRKEGSVLGTRGDHPEWLTGWRNAVHASGMVYHPGGALALRSERVLWTFAAPPMRRPVPVRGLVVAAEQGGVLRAYRRTSSSPETDLRDVAGGLAAGGADARAVLRDGTILAAKLTRDVTGIAAATTPPRRAPAADVLLIEDAAGRLLGVGRQEDLPQAFASLVQEASSAAVVAAVQEACQTRDPQLLVRVAGAAALAGAARAELDRLDARLRELAKPGAKAVKPEPELMKKIDAVFAELAQRPVAAALERYGSLPADAPTDVRADLLRAVLHMDPRSAAAAAAVKKLLPAGVAPPDPFDAAEWLDFVDFAARVPLKVHAPPRPNDPKMTPAQRTVGQYSVSFRPDVFGIESPRILVVTPLRRPGAIARCLSLGEMACESLEALFAGAPPRRTFGQPLTFVLCSTREEYWAEAAKHGFTKDDEAFWASGMYLPSEETAWCYLPDDDAGFDRVIPPLVHDLTFQWLDLRCPAFGFAERRHGSERKGMWAQSGLSVFVEELRFDLRRRTWGADPLAAAVEIVAAAPADRLVPWATVLSVTSDEYDTLGDKWDIEIPGTRRLGQTYSRQYLYFAEAAAVCGYLAFAEGGKQRPKLADAVAAYYRGTDASIETIFGMTPDELGRRTTEWCRAQVQKPR